MFCGFYALFRDKEISLKNRLGQTYLVTTLLTALTGFGILQHDGFGPPHVLGVLTVIALAVGTVAGTTALFGRASRYIQTVSFTTTLLLFHMIPGFTESLTRAAAERPARGVARGAGAQGHPRGAAGGARGRAHAAAPPDPRVVAALSAPGG